MNRLKKNPPKFFGEISMWQDILKVFVNEDIDEFVEELALLYAEKYLNRIKQNTKLYGNTATMIDKIQSMDEAELGGNKTEFLRILEKYPNTTFVDVGKGNIFGIQNGKFVYYNGIDFVNYSNNARARYARIAQKDPSDAKVDVFDQSGFNPQLDDVLTKLVKDTFLTLIQERLKNIEKSQEIQKLDGQIIGTLVREFTATDKIIL
jgi:hypothetical protein